MLMGSLIGNGYVTVKGDMSDTETLRTTINEYFDGSKSGGNAASIPESGALYSGYSGALECLSSGYGDVAFAKDSTPGSYCNNEVASENEAWCLEMSQYVALPKFGSSPSHSVMYNDDVLDDDKEVLIRDALVAMKDDADGLAILNNVLGTSAMIATDADTHLGTYGAALENIPGISSKYGKRKHPVTKKWAMHHGIDLAGTWQEKVRATADGTVVFSGWEGSFGRVVRVQHRFGIQTVYAHLARLNVEKGDYVTSGDVVGSMGSSGRSDGAHLHYEIHHYGESKNPLDYFFHSPE